MQVERVYKLQKKDNIIDNENIKKTFFIYRNIS